MKNPTNATTKLIMKQLKVDERDALDIQQVLGLNEPAREPVKAPVATPVVVQVIHQAPASTNPPLTFFRLLQLTVLAVIIFCIWQGIL